MIDFNIAKKAFKDYVASFDINNSKIRLKIEHTYKVVEACEYIAKDLKLNEEDINLAKLIGLLHDIGRFKQLKNFNSFDDNSTIDHAEYGADILFKDNLIRKFLAEETYDNIIEKAIRNHNKYKIEDNLSERDLLFSKIIRDGDKMDNFRVKEIEKIETLFDISEEEFELESISDNIYNDFINCKMILKSDRKTHMDMWISYLAFIFDFNFSSGLRFLKDNNYINIVIDRIDYKNPDTKEKMKNIKKVANDYIDKKLAL